jgi:CRP-like cAMP-binding protein
MPVDIDSQEAQIIRKMVPFSTMPNSIFKVICDKVVVETARSGTFLFKRGDTAKELIYLLKGEVSLEVDKLKMEVIKAGAESARFALAHQLPRKVNGVAKGTVQFARLNSIYITTPDRAQLQKAKQHTSEQSAVSKEPIKANSQSWLSTLLMIPILRALPPAQMSKITEQLEEVQYSAGEVVVSEGQSSDYYFLIKSGECSLAYKNSTEQTPIVSKLKTWDTFGAEALIADTPSLYTVTALNDLSLLRINKNNFLTLIKEPLLKFINSSDMEILLFRNGVLLDVRPTVEYETLHLDHAVNIPLPQLRNAISTLDKERPIVVFSDKQKISQAAGFLLLTQRFSVHILKDEQSNVESTEPKEAFDFIIDIPEITSFHHTNNNTAKTPSPEVEKPQSSFDTSDLKSSPEILALENSQLTQQLRVFKLKFEKAEQEKQDIMQKCKQLQDEVEKLKAMLAAQAK